MRIPHHVGIIPDGNRRWALAHVLQKHEGYACGLTPGMKAFEALQNYGVQEITYYGFTSDNCKMVYQAGYYSGRLIK